MSPEPGEYSRRHFLQHSRLGFGWLAFTGLTAGPVPSANPLPHTRPAQIA
ncbi:MAG UNVERIFIED_CONTAM: hypothetical protein LVR18_01910 [Planctomycetaceae bacterium]|jgi:hypothetical protein